MTKQEQKAFDLMREALEHIQRCIGFDKATIHQGSATWCEIDDALTAVNAVSDQAQGEAKLPVYFAQYEYAPDFSVVVSVYRRRADDVPELIHSEALPKQIDAHLQATEPASKE